MTERNYSRVYYNDLMADYPDIWDNDWTLSAFVRLLSTADAMWPMRPEVPRSLDEAAHRQLRDCGLLVEMSKGRFTIKGLDAERNARRIAGRNAARSRWGNAKADADAMPNRAEPSQAESPLPLTRGRRKDGTSPRQTGTNPRANGTSPRQERAKEKRGGGMTLHAILEAARKGETA